MRIKLPGMPAQRDPTTRVNRAARPVLTTHLPGQGSGGFWIGEPVLGQGSEAGHVDHGLVEELGHDAPLAAGEVLAVHALRPLHHEWAQLTARGSATARVNRA